MFLVYCILSKLSLSCNGYLLYCTNSIMLNLVCILDNPCVFCFNLIFFSIIIFIIYHNNKIKTCSHQSLPLSVFSVATHFLKRVSGQLNNLSSDFHYLNFCSQPSLREVKLFTSNPPFILLLHSYFTSSLSQPFKPSRDINGFTRTFPF